MVSINLVTTLTGHKGAVWSIVWSISGNFLISVSVDSSLIIWGPFRSFFHKKFQKKSFKEIQYFKFWHKIYQMKISKNSKTFRKLDKKINSNFFSISDFKGYSYLWEIKFPKCNNICIAEIKHILKGSSTEIKGCNFSYDENFFASCGRDKNIWIWKNNFKKKIDCDFIFKENKSDIKCVKWSPTKSEIVSSTYEGNLLLILYEKNNPISTEIKLSNSPIWSIDFSDTGENIIIGNGAGEIFWLRLIRKNSFSMERNVISRSLTINFSSLDSINFLSKSEKNHLYSTGNSIGVANILKSQKIARKSKFSRYKIFRGENFFLINSLFLVNSFHFGKINSILWHPVFDNIFVSSGDDSVLNIWRVC
jgi:WD40 repeat protein